MSLPIEHTRKEIIPYKGTKIDTFKIKGRIRHLKEKFFSLRQQYLITEKESNGKRNRGIL